MHREAIYPQNVIELEGVTCYNHARYTFLNLRDTPTVQGDSVALFVVLVIAGIGLTWFIRRQLADGAKEKRQADAAARRAEERRVQECGELVAYLATNVGYVARQVIDRGEIARLIESGCTAEQLGRTIGERMAALPGVSLGSQKLDVGVIPVVLTPSLRTRHIYCVGKSGSGKTTLLRNLILQDLEDRHGIGVIAPEHEMLFEEILPLIPAHRVDDVVYVNPADTDYPIPLNPLELEEGEDLDLKADETMTILKRLFDEEGGGAAPRMETILRQALYTLMQVPGATFLDMEKLLNRDDPSYREWVLKQIKDESAEEFWKRTYPMYPRDAHLPVINRLGRFLRPKVVRSILCAKGKSFNIRRAMDEGKVLLFNISDGILGEASATLLGQLIVAKIQMAAMSRADTPKERRRPFYLYIDEFQAFCGVAATSYEKILSRARKYGLGLVLAHQQTGQIPEHLMREILGNVSTVVSFVVSASDAKRLSREMVGEINGEPVGLEPEQLLSLRMGEAFCKIDRNVFFMQTYPPPDWGDTSTRQIVIDHSRYNYGQPAEAAKLPKVDMIEKARHRIDAIDPAKVF